MKTLTVVFLLIISNTVMTFAWYWHLKPEAQQISLWKIVLISWSIALLEYSFAVPANHLGNKWGIAPFQLKIIQEAITISVFVVFAVFYLKQTLSYNYIISFVCIMAAVYFAFRKS